MSNKSIKVEKNIIGLLEPSLLWLAVPSSFFRPRGTLFASLDTFVNHYETSKSVVYVLFQKT